MKKLLISALLFASTPAQAREVAVDDGNDMLTICNKSDSYSVGFCTGYIRALSTGVDIIMAEKDLKVCYGENVTIGQIRDVVVDYTRRNPAKRNESAIVLVAYASAEAWPCGK